MGSVMSYCNTVTGITARDTEIQELHEDVTKMRLRLGRLYASYQKLQEQYTQETQALKTVILQMKNTLASEEFAGKVLDAVNHPMMDDKEEKAYIERVLAQVRKTLQYQETNANRELSPKQTGIHQRIGAEFHKS